MKHKQLLKTIVAGLLFTLLVPTLAHALNNGDTFTANTTEGITMTFQVISTTDKTCRVYGKYNSSTQTYTPSIDNFTSGKVTIPSTASGYTVVEIGDYAFYKCEKITAVSMPNTVKTIGYSFYECTSLSAITGIAAVEYITNSSAFYNTPWYNNLPNGMLYIGKVAFKYKGTMPENTTIDIKDGTISITNFAFSGQSNMVGITIPKSVMSIHSYAFDYCYNLSTIVVSSSNTVYDSRNNCNAIIRTADNTLITGSVKTIIPSTVKTIANNAVWGRYVTSVNIPDGVEKVESNAYTNCSKLTSVTIGKGVKTFYGSSFSSCASLKSITVSSSNATYDSRNNCNAVIEKSTNKLVMGCASTVIPSTVTTIGASAFNNKGTNDIFSLTIPNTVEKIEEWSFYNQSNLRSLTIGSSVTEIGTYAFAYNYNLRAIHALMDFPFDINENVFYGTNDSIYNSATLYVPIGSKLNYQSATGWSKFKKIVEIAKDAHFDGEVFTEQTTDGSELIYQIISQNEKTCEVIGCKGTLKGALTIPASANGYSVVSIGYRAFYDNDHLHQLTSVTIPSSVKAIGSYAFGYCESLATINLPNSLISIGDYAFYYCGSLESIKLPSSLERIGYFALGGLGKITSLVIPKSVNFIDRGILTADTLMTSLTVEAGNTVYDSRGGCNAIMETATNTLVAGIHTTVIPKETKTIGAYAFNSQKLLKGVTIPSEVTCIDPYAFNNSGLQNVVIPANVDSIGQSAFRYCRDLSVVTSLIENPTEINENVFYTDNNGGWLFTKATLYVPVGTKSKYQATAGWNKFENIVEGTGPEPDPIINPDPDPDTIKGDVNGDKSVNGTDLVALTNIILGKSAQTAAADVNGDKLVNGTDYVALVNIVLGKSSSRQTEGDASRRFDAATQTLGGDCSHLHLNPFSIAAGETKELVVSLTNPVDVLTLLQFDLALPEGLSVQRTANDFQMNMARRTTWHSHQLSANGDGSTMRLLLASNSNALIDGTEGAVIRLTVTASADFNGGTITLKNILGVSPDEQEANMPTTLYRLTGDVTGIYAIRGEQDTTTIYSLSGQRLATPKNGINIVNGKKIIKK